MRLAKLQNFKFSNLNFYHYFFTAYIGLHVTFSLLLGNITAFAPDENFPYLYVFQNLYIKSYRVSIFTPGFGDEAPPTLFLQLLYGPAKAFSLIGFNELLSLRMMTISYATLATLLLVKIAKFNDRDVLLFRISLVLISALPTVFLWSSVGLRESFLYLEISATLYFLSKIKEKIEAKNLIGIGIAVFSLSMTKNYIFILFLFAFIITLTIFTFTKRKNFLGHLLMLVIASIPLAVNPTLVPAISAYFNGQLAKPESSVVGDFNNDGRCDTFEFCESNASANASANANANASASANANASANGEVETLENIATGGMTVHALLYQLQGNPNTFISKIATALGITAKLEANSKSSRVIETDKTVIENQKKLSLRQAGLTHPDQVIKSSLKFLLIPFILRDNGSLFLNIQSIETPVWLFIYVLFFVGIYQIIRRRRELDYAVMVATIFVLEFVAISALTEINVGTALRHRSLLLIPILVIWLSREKKPASL